MSRMRVLFMIAPHAYSRIAAWWMIVILLFSASVTSAQWIQTSGPPGTDITAMLANGPTLFAGTLKGIYRSTDNGATWTSTNAGLTNLNIFAFATNGTTLFAGALGGDIFRSTDNGFTWADISAGLPGGEGEITLVVKGTTLFVGTNNGVYRSTNNGQTWTAANNGLPSDNGGPPKVRALAVKDTILFAGTDSGNGVYRSLDNGGTWTAANSGLPNKSIQSFAVSGTTLYAATEGSDGVYSSTDNGQTWTAANSGLTNAHVSALVVKGTTLYAGTEGGGVYRYDGSTWTAINTGLTSLSVFSFAVKDTTLFAGTLGGGVFGYSGGAWTALNTGLPTFISVSAVTASGTGLYAGTYSGNVFTSTNNGASWTGATSGLPGRQVNAVVLKGTALFAGTDGGVYRSTNNGATWTAANSGLPGNSVNAFAVKDTLIFVALDNNNGVYRSTNGDSWAAANSGLPGNSVRSLAVSGTTLFAGSDGNGVYRSINNGDSWTAANSGLPGNSVNALAVSGTTLFAAMGHAGVYSSADNGAHWTAANSGLPQDTRVSSLVVSGTTVFAGTEGDGIFRTTDYGATWGFTGLFQTFVSSLTSNGPTLYAGTLGGGVYKADASILGVAPLRKIKVRLTVSGKAKVGILPITFTEVPIDSGTIDLGSPNVFEHHDVSSLPFGEQLQSFVDALTNMAVTIPDEAIPDENITLHFDIRNIDVTDPNNIRIAPVIVQSDTIPVFFLIRMSIETRGGVLDRFDFKDGFPLVLKLPLAQFTTLLQNSGFTNIPLDSLALAFLTPNGFTKQGIFSIVKNEDLIVRITHLSDLAGIKTSSLAPPPLPSIIQGPSVDADTSSALVTWRTDQPANSAVLFGLTTALGDSAKTLADESGVTEHHVALGAVNPLTKATKYYYRVRSTDPFGRTVASPIDSFRTRGVADIAPPIITLGPFTADVTPTSATIAWDTDKRATSVVQYDTTATLGHLVSDASLDLRHRVTLAGLIANKLYHYLVSSTGRGGTVVSDTVRFTTPSVLDTLPPVIITRPHVDSYGVTDTTALIAWETDIASNSQVLYWRAGTSDTTLVVDPLETTGHLVILTHLQADTHYRYLVRSTRSSNNRSVVSQRDDFTTLPSGQVVDLQFIVSPHIVYRSDRRVIFAWQTNIPSDGAVYYMPDPTGTAVFSIDASLVRSHEDLTTGHRVSVGGLIPGASYLFVITSSAQNGSFLVWPPGIVFAKPIVRGTTRMLVPTGRQQVPGSTGRFTTNNQPDTQAPVILSGPTVVGRTASQLVLQWQTDEISTSVVNYGTGSNLTSTAQDPQQVTLHQITLTNLAAHTTYNYQVASTDPSNNGPTQSPQSVASTAVTTDTTPPVIDAASITASPSDTRAILQWTTDEPANSTVKFGTSPDSLKTTLTDPATVTSHSFTLTSLASSRTYYYQVFATDLSGNGPTPSATKSFTTLATADTAQPVITNIQKTASAAGTTATLTVTWTTNKLATTAVDYDTLTTIGQVVGNQTGTLNHSVSLTQLKLGRMYYFKVASVNVNDPRVPAPTVLSALDSVQTPLTADTTPPSTPATVAAIPGDGAVRLRWTPSTDLSGIAGYNILRNSTTLATNIPDTTYLDNTATNGTTYSYAVAAIDRAGNPGTASTVQTATPDTNKVATKPTAAATSDTVSLKPILIVSNASPVSGDATRATLTYAFQVATDSLFTALIAAKTGVIEGTSTNPTHWQVIDPGRSDSTALVTGTRYWWRSRANDGVFDGGWSATRTFIPSSSKPSAVELATFTATDERGVVTVAWTVTRAQSLTGFNLYRSLRPSDGFEKLNRSLLTGATAFQYVDRGVQVNQLYYYQVEAVSSTGQTTRFGPIALRVSAPKVFALGQNYPNPFNPETTIRFDLPTPSKVTLKIYNLLGQEVVTLLNGEPKEAGFYTIRWNGRTGSGERAASGVYFYRIEAGSFVKAKKMVLVK